MIPLIKPGVSYDAVADQFREIIESGQLTSGKYVRAFEGAVADYLGVTHAFTTTSATTAMHLTLVGMDVGPGDEVLVSDFTFPATGNVVVQIGATPVLVDCRAGQFDMDPEDLEAKVTEKTRAVIVVHPFGQPADMAAINKVAATHGFKVLEDAACALGATLPDGQACGAVSDAGCFSFHPRKLLTTGEGGMIVTNDDFLAARIEILRSHGGVRGRVGMDFIENGFNYRMSEIQAALGLEQINRFDPILEERRCIAQMYLSQFNLINSINVPMSGNVAQCNFQSFVVLLGDDVNRDVICESMKAAGVETTLGTYAMHRHPAFSKFGYKPGDLPHASYAETQSLTLPLFAGMQEKEVRHIVNTLVMAIDAT
jgi:perosamine synthetase